MIKITNLYKLLNSNYLHKNNSTKCDCQVKRMGYNYYKNVSK